MSEIKHAMGRLETAIGRLDGAVRGMQQSLTGQQRDMFAAPAPAEEQQNGSGYSALDGAMIASTLDQAIKQVEDILREG